MSYTFLVIALAIAVVNWVAVEKRWKLVEYVAKPGTMVVLLLWLVLNGGLSWPMILFLLGLVFSLAGDVFLMLPRDQFIAGLASFLLAHVAYVIGFNTTPPPFNILALTFVVVVLITAQQIYRVIANGLDSQGLTRLKMPVQVYTIVIGLMLISALWTLARYGEWTFTSALLVTCGAVAFLVSDTILAYNKFVKPISHGRLMNMATYHLGQVGIALGAALHFLR